MQCKTDDTTKHEDLNLVFANHGKEDEIYPLTIIEIAEAQKKDRNIKIYYKRNAKTPEKGMRFQLIENTKVPCKEDKLIIPASLQHRAVSWYHHYLQHPGHSRLEETKRFRDILERYATYHPIICQILQILPGQ